MARGKLPVWSCRPADASMTRIGTCVPAVRFAVRLFNTCALGSACTSRSVFVWSASRKVVKSKFTHRRGVDELQRRARNARRGVGDRRDRVAAERESGRGVVSGSPSESSRGTMSLKNCCCEPRS